MTLRPLYQGSPHPDQIIPSDFKADFVAHFRATWKTKTTDDYDRAEKNIPAPILEKIARIWEAIRAAGWRPVGLNAHNQIEWGYIPDTLGSLGLDFSKWSKDQIINAIINGKLPKVKTIPQATRNELAYEREKI